MITFFIAATGHARQVIAGNPGYGIELVLTVDGLEIRGWFRHRPEEERLTKLYIVSWAELLNASFNIINPAIDGVIDALKAART